MKTISLSVLCAALLLPVTLARAQTPSTAPAAPADLPAEEAIKRLREGLIESFNKGDADSLLTYLTPDVLVTWQNGEVCHGPAEVRAYYDKMMKGDHPVVKSVSASPVVEDRHIHDGWALSVGKMNDNFVLTSGEELAFNSRFTATIVRSGDRWLVSGFHVSVNAFDNPILGTAVHKSMIYSGLGAGVCGLVVGVIVGLVLGKRKSRARTVA